MSARLIERAAVSAGITEAQARAFLEAMYEPSDTMTLAGELMFGLFDKFGIWDEDDCRLIWKAMIAELLDEHTKAAAPFLRARDYRYDAAREDFVS